MRSWIGFWLKRNDQEFAEEAKKWEEADRQIAEYGVSPITLAPCPRRLPGPLVVPFGGSSCGFASWVGLRR
jgi:hypothetical protein